MNAMPEYLTSFIISFLLLFRSIWKVANEICGSFETKDATKKQQKQQSADDIWKSLLTHTSTRARPLIDDDVPEDQQNMSATRLKVCVLSNLLDCAVQCADLEQRRSYIQKIMGLSKTVQKTLMTLIEQRTKKKSAGGGTPTTSRSTPTKSVNSSSRRTPERDSMKKPSSRPASPWSGGACGSRNHSPSAAASMSTPQRAMTCYSRNDSTHSNYTQTTTPPRRPSSRARSSSMRSPSGLTPATSRRKTESLLSPGTMDSPNAIQSIVTDLRARNERLVAALEQSKQRETEMQQSLDTISGEHRKQMIQLEVSQRDQMLEMQAEHNQDVQLLSVELKRYQTLAEEGQQARKELDSLRDEMDVLQHNGRIVQETTEKLRRYKDKVAELNDVKTAHQREQEQHAQSIEECLRLTNEVEQLRTAKRQLDEYKVRAIEAEVKLVECQDHLQRLEEQTNEQSAKNEQLWKGSVTQREQLEDMRRRMEQESSSSTSGSASKSRTVGEGISEFNPQVVEELTRLRNENGQLRAFAAKREQDAVTQMENDLDDTKRLADRFKNEFLTTKDILAKTHAQLTESISREKVLQEESTRIQQQRDEVEHSRRIVQEQLEECENRLNLTQQMLEDTEQSLVLTKEQAEQWKRRSHELEEESNERMIVLTSLKEELEETTRELDITSQSVLDLQARMVTFENQASEMEANISSLCDQIQDKDTALLETQGRLSDQETALEEARARVQELQTQHSHMEEHVQHLTAENQQLVQQLEEEKQVHHAKVAEAQATLERTRSEFDEKYKTDVEDMRGNLNCLLDDERRTSQSMVKEYEQKLTVLESKWKRICDEIEAEKTALLAQAEESQTQLIEKGQRMIQDTKMKAKQEVQSLEEHIQLLTQEKDDVEKLLRNKVHSLRSKLDYSSRQINELTQEGDELQDQIKSLEREKYQLQEDNDRYKRQLGGGHYGVGGSMQAQLDTLQKEYNAILQENRNLKREMKNVGDLGSIMESEPSTEASYSRGGNHSRATIQELRRDYEEQIEFLKDEKRELVMKSSMAANDVTKAEQRALEREREVAKLKAEMTALKLAIARQEMNNDDSVDYDEGVEPESNTVENQAPVNGSFMSEKNSSFHTAHSGNTPEAPQTPNRRPRLSSASRSPSIERASRKLQNQEKALRSKISMLTGNPPPRSPPLSANRAGGSPARSLSASGQRYKLGITLLDSELDTSHQSPNATNVLSPTKRHEYQANQQHPQQPQSSSTDIFGLGIESDSLSASKINQQLASPNLSDVARLNQDQSENANAVPECQQS